MGEFAINSELGVAADELWADVGTLEGVNRELGPWLRMTAPAGLRGATLSDLTPGVPAGRAWMLLGGVLPVDYDELCLEEIGELHFRERSRMLTIDPWTHERTVEPLGERSCRITDRLGFRLRRPLRSVPGADRLPVAVVGALFRHRHRRLAKLYGAPTDRTGEQE